MRTSNRLFSFSFWHKGFKEALAGDKINLLTYKIPNLIETLFYQKQGDNQRQLTPLDVAIMKNTTSCSYIQFVQR